MHASLQLPRPTLVLTSPSTWGASRRSAFKGDGAEGQGRRAGEDERGLGFTLGDCSQVFGAISVPPSQAGGVIPLGKWWLNSDGCVTGQPRDQFQVMSCGRGAENRERAAGRAWGPRLVCLLASRSERDGGGDRAARLLRDRRRGARAAQSQCEGGEGVRAAGWGGTKARSGRRRPRRRLGFPGQPPERPRREAGGGGGGGCRGRGARSARPFRATPPPPANGRPGC